MDKEKQTPGMRKDKKTDDSRIASKDEFFSVILFNSDIAPCY